MKRQHAETCSDCGGDIPAHVVRWYEITGWTSPRAQGGINAVSKREETGRVRCADCMRKAKSNVIPGQESLI